MDHINIIEIIEKNPIANLSKEYNGKLINKIKENFSEFEKQLFVSSFYCYLNYNKNNDFVIDFDDVWKWLGFTFKENAKRVLDKFFTLNKDYKTYRQIGEITESTVKQNGGQNKKNIFLTINCFKSFCLKSQTKKSTQIHEYYMKLEEIINDVIKEETTELKQQIEKYHSTIEEKDNIITNIQQQSKEEKEKHTKEKQKAKEETLVTQFPVNTECIYIGTIDNTNAEGEKLVKFGQTNHLSNRLTNHRKTYNNFILYHAFRVQNKVEMENLIKMHPQIKKRIRSIKIDDKNKNEIIAYDDKNFNLNRICKFFQDIIDTKTYSIENMNRIMKENELLIIENEIIKEENKNMKLENIRQTAKIEELEENVKIGQKIISTFKTNDQSVFTNILLPEDELHSKFNEFVSAICIVRPDVEELSVNIEGRFRIWSQIKPKKETFHALKNYLDIRFKPKRVGKNHGYSGIRLKQVEYTRQQETSDIQTFVFNECEFSDKGRILNTVLLKEYQKWKSSINKPISENDMKEIKEYLDKSPYALKSTVWTDQGNNEGYYGISMKENTYKPKLKSSTGKKLEKRLTSTNELLGEQNSIADAALAENISAAKMSSHVKNRVSIKNPNGDYYYMVKNLL